MKDIAATLLNFSMSILPVMAMVILALPSAAAVIYLMFSINPDGARRSMVQFALHGLAAGSAAGFLGMGIGIAFFCSYSLGNLCGIGGVLFTGPLAFCLAVIAYLLFWARNGKAP